MRIKIEFFSGMRIFFIVSFLVFPFITNAATIILAPSTSNVNVGNIISLKVNVNTQGVDINNGEAVIRFPTDLLEVVSVSKSASIFSLWVEEPTFSNLNGQLTFNGGVANPGFNGSNGTMATITFKAKKAGTASVIVSDASVRQNDGLGTNVLSSKSGATIQVGKDTEAPSPAITPSDNTILSKPVISSDTHPDQGTWYVANTASFSWKVQNSATGVQAILNKTANAVPNILYDNSVTQKTLSNLSDGVYYFHLRFLSTSGSSPVAHYQVNIDNTAPNNFTPSTRSADNQNYITLNAEDSTSGISYYNLKIDDGPIIKVKKSELIKGEFLLPVLSAGTHDVVVIAYDKAGNHTESNTTFNSTNISAPEMMLSTKEITSGESIIISGATDYPNSTIEVTLESGGKIIKKYKEVTGDDGKFSFATDKIKTTGQINIWAENVFSGTVHSGPSVKQYLKVNETEAVKVTFALFWLIMIIALFTVLLFILYEGWHKFFGLRRKIDIELEHTALETHKAMLLFKEELSNQLDLLEKIKSDRVLNKKEQAIFKELQKNVDDIDSFIEMKLKKLM